MCMYIGTRGCSSDQVWRRSEPSTSENFASETFLSTAVGVGRSIQTWGLNSRPLPSFIHSVAEQQKIAVVHSSHCPHSSPDVSLPSQVHINSPALQRGDRGSLSSPDHIPRNGTPELLWSLHRLPQGWLGSTYLLITSNYIFQYASTIVDVSI